MEYSGFDAIENQIQALDRNTVRRLVEAGANALTDDLKQTIEHYHHVGKTGSMQSNVRPGKYHEDVNSGWVEVYPQGTDPRGVSNAKKAFVINYGYGGKRTAKTGDKFITGNKRKFEDVVNSAMIKENETIIQEINNGG